MNNPIPESELRFTFSRSSGPGGQNVNKLSTRAQLHVSLDAIRRAMGDEALHRLVALAGPARVTDAGELTIVADETRSQKMNKQACLDRLRVLMLQAARRPKVRRATRPTAGSRRRRIESKKHRAEVKKHRGAPRDGA